MEVFFAVTKFVCSSLITGDRAKPLIIVTELIGWSPNDEPISSQMNHSSSGGEEPMTNANGRHRTTTLSSQTT